MCIFCIFVGATIHFCRDYLKRKMIETVCAAAAAAHGGQIALRITAIDAPRSTARDVTLLLLLLNQRESKMLPPVTLHA